MNKQLILFLLIFSVGVLRPMGFFRLTDESCFILSAGVNAITHASTDDWVDPTLVGTVVTGGALWCAMQWFKSEGFVCADPSSKIIFASAGAIAGMIAGKAVRYTVKGVRYTLCAIARKLFFNKKQEKKKEIQVSVYPDRVEYITVDTQINDLQTSSGR